MITQETAIAFAQEWVASWNALDLDRVLSHYTDDFTIETPVALKFVPESEGVLKGKKAVRAYWELALEKIPDLHFEILDVLTGINAVTIYYFNKATGRKSTEVMFFDEAKKVYKSYVQYS